MNDLYKLPIDIDAYFREMRDGSDRACALVAGSATSEQLKTMIAEKLTRMNPDLEQDLFYAQGAPLSSLSNRTKIAFAIGLIDDEQMAVANTIRKIRNVFAHTPNDLTFSTAEIATECRKLSSADEFPDYGCREWFILSGISLFMQLHKHALSAMKRRALVKALYDSTRQPSTDRPG